MKGSSTAQLTSSLMTTVLRMATDPSISLNVAVTVFILLYLKHFQKFSFKVSTVDLIHKCYIRGTTREELVSLSREENQRIYQSLSTCHSSV